MRFISRNAVLCYCNLVDVCQWLFLKVRNRSLYLAAPMTYDRSGLGRVIIALSSTENFVPLCSTSIMPEIWFSILNKICFPSTRKSVVQFSSCFYDVPGGPKNVALYFCLYLRQLLINFQTSFTGTLCGQFAITWSLHTVSSQSINSSLYYLVKYQWNMHT